MIAVNGVALEQHRSCPVPLDHGGAEARKGKPIPSDHVPLVVGLDRSGHPFDPGWMSIRAPAVRPVVAGDDNTRGTE